MQLFCMCVEHTLLLWWKDISVWKLNAQENIVAKDIQNKQAI
jgi:hypothetical protein